MDIINPDKFYVNLLKGFDFTVVKVSIFPVGNWRRRYAHTAQPVIDNVMIYCTTWVEKL